MAPPTSAAKPRRVVIVGGGCAGIAAAWQLSRLPGYDIHVYEKSNCLGGKGGSVRDDDGLVREHGLHLWLGFYENAFRMMRECYAEVRAQGFAPDAEDPKARLPHGSIDDAFFPEPHIGVGGRDANNQWTAWSGFLPPAKGLPGEPFDVESNPFTITNYVLRCFELLKALMLSVIQPPARDAPGEPRPNARSTIDEIKDLDFSFDPTRSTAALIENIARLLRNSALTSAAGLLQAVTILETSLHKLNHSQQVANSVVQLLEAVAAQMRKQLRDLVAVDETLRWKTDIISIVMTIAVGLYRDRVLFEERGLDAINNIDYRDWLRQHGATHSALESNFITGIYDLVFAYRNGDHDRPALAAGVALRGALRMFFTYRGSMFWRMRSGMGDAVFAPLYKVLLLDKRKTGPKTGQSPVKFHFLHTLRSAEFDWSTPGERYVTRLSFTTQGDPATLDRLGDQALDDCGCWPADARRFEEAIAVQPEGEVILQVQPDAVVFALGVDDFVDACANVDPDTGSDRTALFTLPEWKTMRREVAHTVATQCAQVWLDRDLESLGWHRGSGIVAALGLSFDTWADMTQVLATERDWRRRMQRESSTMDNARSVAYFCAVAPDSTGPHPQAEADDKVESDLRTLLEKELAPVWPSVFDPEKGSTASNATLRHYARANIAGSDRYVLSLPGTIEHRISPLDRSVLNMVVAGDWTACGLDAGCVEAAVMSGMLAVHAVTSDKPTLESIIGYDHP